MKTLTTTLRGLALATFAAAMPVMAFNQDHFFVYKTLPDVPGGRNTIGVGIGPDDKIYVPEYNQKRFGIYDPDLNLLNYVTPVPDCWPHDIIVGNDGTVYVADPSGSKVRRFDSSGTPLTDLTTGFAAHYVRIHPTTGNLYIKDSGGGYRVCQPDGTLVKEFALPDGNLFAVLPDGRLHLTSGTIYNDLGIQERTGLPGGQDLRYAGGVLYTGNYNGYWYFYGGDFRLFDADFNQIIRYGYGGSTGDWFPNFGYRFNINHKGDIIGSDSGAIYLLRRCEGSSMGPEIRNAAPMAEVNQIAQRPNTTLLDIDYKVTDMDDATVQVAAAAFTNNVNTLDNMILLNTLMEGTEVNVGPAMPRDTVHRLTWDVGQDWGADFGNVSVHVFVRDTRSGLMGLHYLSLPADGPVPAMQITRSPLQKTWFLEPLMWLVASKNTSVVFTKTTAGVGNIHGTNTAPLGYRGELLASGNTVTQKGWQFIASLMGAREASEQEVLWAREAATPGIVNQWDLSSVVTQKIDGDRPRKVNEYGFDSGDYDTEWIWLIKN
jgi:hypothetical protein